MEMKSRYIARFAVTALAVCLVALLPLAFSACSDSDCSLGGRPSVRFAFVNSLNRAPVSLFDSLTVTAFDTDSVLVNRERGIDHVTLPLSYSASTTTFVLHYSRFLRDTITVMHTNHPHFISIDCGISMFYHLDGLEHTSILLDSIQLIDPDIDDNEKNNYRIYYTPDE